VVLKVVRFFGLLLAALTAGLGFCHALELPGKLALAPADWLTAQHTLYNLFGPTASVSEVGAIVLAWMALVLVRGRQPASLLTLIGAVSLTTALLVWFVVVDPVNLAVATWTADAIPADWEQFRNRWEFGHMGHAVLLIAGFVALVLAVLADTPDRYVWNAKR